MKLLPVEFTKSGWTHQQVWRDANFAIYKRWKEGGLAPHFEAIRILRHDAHERFGVQFEAGESYPGKSVWGRLGFTLPTLEAAREKIDKLQAALAEKFNADLEDLITQDDD